MHIDLKNAFRLFLLPRHARSFFRLWPGPGLPALEREPLPLGWKYSPYFRHTARAGVLQVVVPRGVPLVHYLDDFLLVYTKAGVLSEGGGAVLRALMGSWLAPKAFWTLCCWSPNLERPSTLRRERWSPTPRQCSSCAWSG